ncbi:DUF6380 family protein [Streptomyces sp. NPDC052701]
MGWSVRPVRGGDTGGNRRATLRSGTASLTKTAVRAPFEQRGGRAGEGA